MNNLVVLAAWLLIGFAIGVVAGKGPRPPRGGGTAVVCG